MAQLRDYRGLPLAIVSPAGGRAGVRDNLAPSGVCDTPSGAPILPAPSRELNLNSRMGSNEVGRGQTGLSGDIKGVQTPLSINTLQIQSRGQSGNQWNALPTDPPRPVGSSLCTLLLLEAVRTGGQ